MLKTARQQENIIHVILFWKVTVFYQQSYKKWCEKNVEREKLIVATTTNGRLLCSCPVRRLQRPSCDWRNIKGTTLGQILEDTL